MKTEYVMCAGGLVAQCDTVKLKNGNFLFWQRYLDFYVTDIFDDRIMGRIGKTGEMISIPRNDFICLIKPNDVARARIKDEINRMRKR